MSAARSRPPTRSVDWSAPSSAATLLVSALAEVARDYVSLRGVQAQHRHRPSDNLQIAEDVLHVVAQERQRTGLQNALDSGKRRRDQIEGVQGRNCRRLSSRNPNSSTRWPILLDEPPGALRARTGLAEGQSGVAGRRAGRRAFRTGAPAT